MAGAIKVIRRGIYRVKTKSTTRPFSNGRLVSQCLSYACACVSVDLTFSIVKCQQSFSIR